MILIVSNIDDYPTDTVIDWLMASNEKFFRINGCDHIHLSSIEMASESTDFTIEVRNTFNITYEFKFSEINSVWYRRGFIDIDFSLDKVQDEDVRFYLKNSKNTISEFIYFMLKRKPHINSFTDNYINKLVVLEKARYLGFKVPYSKIDTKFIKTDTTNFITKEFNQMPLKLSSSYVSSLTSVLDTSIYKSNHSLIQHQIQKKYEVRSFYVNEKLFSMAIFSQSNSQTNVDFRNYDFEKPNRMVCFQLPLGIEKKLKLLFKQLSLNSGSADFIYDTNNEFIFLEINPVGQWQFVSESCNYQIDKYIAKQLMNYERAR